MPVVSRPSCPSCGHPIDFLPGTLAVKCGACGSVLHVEGLSREGPRVPMGPAHVNVTVTLDPTEARQVTAAPERPSPPAAAPSDGAIPAHGDALASAERTVT